MKSWVREKLKQIEELYPAERLNKSKARYQAIWSGILPEDRYPFVFSPLGFNYYDDVMDKELGLRTYLDEFINRGFVEDDFIPAFFPGCKTSTIPGMFGAREIVLDGDYSGEKILHKPEDIDNLPFPTITAGTPAFEWLEMQKYYLEECEGEIPIHVCDMQGPMDVCGMLFGYDNLFLCAYDDEERYNKLMQLVCDAFTMLWDAQKDLLGDHFVGTHLFGWNWIPPDCGATMSVDSMAMISEDFFVEFYESHIKTLAERYNGITVHSCGDFSAVVKALTAIPGVKAVNASQMPSAKLIESGWDPTKPIIAFEDINHAEQVFEMAKKPLFLDITFGGLWADKKRSEIIEKARRVADLATLGASK